MGIIQKYTMCLLAMLAALVIIVNSEEELDPDFRHELRPRNLETPSHEQHWRTMETEPIIQRANKEEWDKKMSDETPKRRRNGRKRRRRPLSTSDDIVPDEAIVNPEDTLRPYFDVESDDAPLTTEISTRRQKKPKDRPLRWRDDAEEYDRPFRQRTQRRKRPLLVPWPELSEFDKYRPDDNIREAKISPSKPRKGSSRYEDTEHPRKYNSFDKESISETLGLLPEKPYVLGEETNSKKDMSVSEFSSEITAVHKSLSDDNESSGILDVKSKYKEKVIGSLKPFEKAKGINNPNSPKTLKDILKISNGTSLSEILQQHNLSLTDLLHGKQDAVSIFEAHNTSNDTIKTDGASNNTIHREIDVKESNISETFSEAEIATTLKEYPKIIEEKSVIDDKNEHHTQDFFATTLKPSEDKTVNILTTRRMPLGKRKKLHIRPMLNNTFKAQLSRDLVTLNSRKYAHHRRNMTKHKEWKDVISPIAQNASNIKGIHNETIILDEIEPSLETTTTVDEALTIINIDNASNITTDTNTEIGIKLDDINMDQIEDSKNSTKNKIVDIKNDVRATLVTITRPTAISPGLRRQAFNNRLKRKRMKNKNPTTERPHDDIITHLLGMGDIVSSSEFIAQTDDPKNDRNNRNDYTTNDDYLTTESSSYTETNNKYEHSSSQIPLTEPKLIQTTTEETAKIEIEEILNDTQTSAKLSRILMERNMTLSELVELRERGSSYVHLTDIFHNTSRESNPPEPFLSKSLIEPISREIYPLRAILEANLHDPTGKATTNELNMTDLSKVNIPVVMDYRNNVNENGENLGIMSLFNNYTRDTDIDTLMKDSEGRPYKTSIIPVNITNTTHEPEREGRTFHDNYDDVVSWNEIFSLMRKNYSNEHETTNNAKEPNPARQKALKNIRLDTDVDGDGVIVLEDLQHLKDFDSNIASASDEKLEVRPYEKVDDQFQETGVLEAIPRQTKSVTVATASIAGLAMVLFLLTYVVFKWREQNSKVHKKRSFSDDRIPTPVFENRKGHKNNSSMRSISPMIQTSNIYTLNTLDSKTGKESPDYMWDTLRKPFQ